VFGVELQELICSDDQGETPALKFIQLAENEGYKVKCYDPHVSTSEYPVYGLDEAVRDSELHCPDHGSRSLQAPFDPATSR